MGGHEESRSAPEISNWTIVRRLLKLSWQYKAGAARMLALQTALLVIGLSGLNLTGVGIDFLRHQLVPNSPAPRWPFHLEPPQTWTPVLVILAVAAGILGLSMLRGALTYLNAVEVARFVQMKIVVDLRAKVYEKLQRLSFRFYDENHSGSIINRVTRDVQSTRLFIDGVIVQGLVTCLSLAVYLVYMLGIHPGLTAACLATTPLLWLVSAVFSRAVRPAYFRNRELVDRMILILSESVSGIQVIKGFAREPETLSRFNEANRKVRDQNAWIFRKVSAFSPGIGFLTQINLVVLLSYGGYLATRNRIPLGTGMIVFAGLLQHFSAQIANLTNLANSIQESLSGARRMFEILDTPVDIKTSPNPKPLPKKGLSIAFEKVSFGYDPEDLVLKDITFSVAPGQCVAILGPTGSGKSTLMSLIPRFYDPTSGRVLIGGIDARDLDVDELRRRVGIVFQESFLFSNTVAANIAFGCPDATPEQIEKAARIAAAHDFITAMPNGYDTLLAEGGSDLSGGQRQRIAIARAIVTEPDILLLDDPTAAIDPETEGEILEAMENAMRGRTTFVVAHRLSTLRRADMILVLDKGRLIQQGTHEQLMSVKGPYRGVAMLQVVDDESLRLLEGRSG